MPEVFMRPRYGTGGPRSVGGDSKAAGEAGVRPTRSLTSVIRDRRKVLFLLLEPEDDRLRKSAAATAVGRKSARNRNYAEFAKAVRGVRDERQGMALADGKPASKVTWRGQVEQSCSHSIDYNWEGATCNPSQSLVSVRTLLLVHQRISSIGTRWASPTRGFPHALDRLCRGRDTLYARYCRQPCLLALALDDYHGAVFCMARCWTIGRRGCPRTCPPSGDALSAAGYDTNADRQGPLSAGWPPTRGRAGVARISSRSCRD